MKFKLLIYAVFALSFLSIASAEIGFVDFDRERYNLGDKLAVTHNITHDEDIDVLLRVELSCPSVDIEYFVAPLSLVAGELVEISTPSISLSARMLGECSVTSKLESIEEGTISEVTSDSFFIGGELAVLISTEDREIRPNEGLEVDTEISASYTAFGTAEVIFFIDDVEVERLLTNISTFTYVLDLFENMSAGDHTLSTNVADGFGNSGSNVTAFTIFAMPTELELVLDIESVLPSGEILITTNLYDQAGNPIDDDVSIEIYNSDGDKIYADTLETGFELVYALSSQAKPGEYEIKAYSTGLKHAQTFAVESLENLEIDIIDAQYLTFKNTGNIDYEKSVDIVLTSTDWEYLLEKELSLEPSEEFAINLFTEVPGDTYNIKVVRPDGSTVLFENVVTEDERSIGKKTGDTVTSITGLIPGINVGPESRGTANRVPGFVYAVVLAMVFLAYFVYTRGQRTPRQGQPPRTYQSPKRTLDKISTETEHVRPKPKKQLQIKSAKDLSRDDPEVKNWLSNLRKNKKF